MYEPDAIKRPAVADEIRERYENGEIGDENATMSEMMDSYAHFEEAFENEIKDLPFDEMVPLIKGLAEEQEDLAMFMDCKKYTDILDHIADEEIGDEVYPVLDEYYIYNEMYGRTTGLWSGEIPDTVYRAYKDFEKEIEYAREQVALDDEKSL